MVAYRKQPDLVCVSKAVVSCPFLSVIQGDVIGRRMDSVWEAGRHDKGSLIPSFALSHKQARQDHLISVHTVYTYTFLHSPASQITATSL